MIQTLDNYGYEESVYMKPEKRNYKVTISSEDHIITIEDDGALLARLGLELVGSTLYLKGYDNVTIAQTDIPLSTGIKDITYDKQRHVITFVIIKTDGTTENYDIDISDLVDLYQSGKGIEITEDENGNKTINVKIDEDSKNILSADEDGLAIDLSNYLTKDSMESISGLVETEKERAEGVEEDLRKLIKAEEDRATAKESALTQNIIDTNANVAACVNQLNENIAKVVTDLNAAIFTESQRAIAQEKSLNDDILKCVTKEEAEAKYATKEEISGFSAAIDSISAKTDVLDAKIDKAIEDGEQEHAEINSAITAIYQVDSDQWDAINVHTDSIDQINSAITALQDVDTQQWGAISTHTTQISDINTAISALQATDTQQWNAIGAHSDSIDQINSAITALQTTDTQQWSVIGAHSDSIDQINSAITALQDVDTQQWAAINNKVDKEEGKGLSTNDFTDEDKEKLDNVDVDAIYAAITSGDTILEVKILAVSAQTVQKVDSSVYEAKVAEIKENEDRIESLIPSLSGYATEQWVEDKGYITNAALEPYSTTSEMQRICVTEEEWKNERKPELLNEISAIYATKAEIPSLSGYATEEWVENKNYIVSSALDAYYTSEQIDEFNKTFATKTELKDGLASKVDTLGATAIAKETVDNVLKDYTPTSGITKMVEDGVNDGMTKAVASANTYTDGAVNSAITETEAYTDSEIAKTTSAISQNAKELHVLSVCNDGDEYDTTKAMSAQGTGVVDESYRLIHKLLSGLDENDLTALNTKLKELIGK